MKPPFTNVTIPPHVLDAMTSETPEMRMGGKYIPPMPMTILESMGIREADPSGKSSNEPGAKLDAGKIMPSLILSAMPRALMAVAEIATFGARKYSKDGWISVPDGINRYTDAMDRHRLKETIEGPIDTDSGLLHAAHLAWGALARLELMLREEAKRGGTM